MKIRTCLFLFFVSFILLIAGCNDSKQTKTETEKEKSQIDGKTDTEHNTNIKIEAPDFADPELKRFYSDYTAYIKKVVAAIRHKDEAGTMKLFQEEGKQYNNTTEMEKKAKAADEQKFNAWLMQAISYQSEIVQSDYFKKFNEAYYKKVKEDFKKNENK